MEVLIISGVAPAFVSLVLADTTVLEEPLIVNLGIVLLKATTSQLASVVNPVAAVG